MQPLDQLKEMRDAAVKMRDEAKERLEAKLREIQTGPDARLIEGLGPVIEGYDKVLGLSEESDGKPGKASAEKEDDASDDGALAAVEGAEPEPVGEEDDTGATAKQPEAKKASAKPKAGKTDGSVSKSAPDTTVEPAPEPSENADTTRSDPKIEGKSAEEEISLEDSLEAELLGEFGKP